MATRKRTKDDRDQPTLFGPLGEAPKNIPVGYCQCGCGLETALATRTVARLGYVKGQPLRFRLGHQGRGIASCWRPGDPVKRCSACGKTKFVEEFSFSPSRIRPESQCKACVTERAGRWQKANPERYRWNYLKRAYGITREEFEAMLLRQHGVCDICRQPETVVNKWGNVDRLSIDHDHETKKIRALLCRRCNSLAAANPTLLREVAAYLERHQEEA